MPPKKQDKTVAEIHDEIILLENKIKAVELKLVTDKEKLIALKQTEERILSEMEERIRQEQTEARLSTKRKTIPKAVKITLWNKFFGEDNAKGKCEVCQREIKMTEFDAGHIIAVTNGGSDNLDNLAPVCGTCNKSMGTQNLQDFKTVYFLPSSSPKDEGAPVPVSVDLLSF